MNALVLATVLAWAPPPDTGPPTGEGQGPPSTEPMSEAASDGPEIRPAKTTVVSGSPSEPAGTCRSSPCCDHYSERRALVRYRAIAFGVGWEGEHNARRQRGGSSRAIRHIRHSSRFVCGRSSPLGRRSSGVGSRTYSGGDQRGDPRRVDADIRGHCRQRRLQLLCRRRSPAQPGCRHPAARRRGRSAGSIQSLAPRPPGNQERRNGALVGRHQPVRGQHPVVGLGTHRPPLRYLRIVVHRRRRGTDGGRRRHGYRRGCVVREKKPTGRPDSDRAMGNADRSWLWNSWALLVCW